MMISRTDPDFARVAGMIGHPTRAAMLAALLGGDALPAGELARRAGVEPSTASGHLARLTSARLTIRTRNGRHVYYSLASADVAGALESLARVAAPRRRTGALSPATNALHFARTCYDHLAGRLGILITDALLARGVLTAPGYALTESGAAWMGGLGIDVAALRRQRRTLTRPCLDWSERRDHLAGSVGAALATTMLERRWLARLDGSRAVRLTVRGREGLYRTLGLVVQPI